MCYQIVELYSSCRCLYYQHPIDKCARFGRPRHSIQKQTTLVDYACHAHSGSVSCLPSNRTPTRAQEPANEKEKPANKKEKLATAKEKPANEKEKLATEIDKPANEKEKLATEIDKPANSNEKPANEKVNPANEKKKPANKKEKLVTAKEKPTNAKEKPANEKKKPANKKEKLATAKEKPANEKKKPANAKQTPPRESGAEGAPETKSQGGPRRPLTHPVQDPELQKLWRIALERFPDSQSAKERLSGCIAAYVDQLKQWAETPVQVQAAEDLEAMQSQVVAYVIDTHYPHNDSSQQQQPREKEAVGGTPIGPVQDRAAEVLRLEAFTMKNELLSEFKRKLKLLGTTSSWPDRSSRSAVRWAVTCIQNAADRWKSRHFIDDVSPDPTARRIEWCCPACGRVVLDDYVEKSPGALLRLEELLGEYSKLRWERLAHSAPAQQPGSPQTRDCNGPSSFRRWIASCVNSLPQQSLPRHHEDAEAINDDDPESCKDQRQKPGQISSKHHSFVLLCIPFLRWGTKAHQPDVCAVRSDQRFFHLMRMAHAAYRTQYPWSWLKRVALLRLVKFEMFRNRLVNISQSPFLPIGVDFDHEPTDTEPPIGANLMMHLFENPDHADIFPVLFKRIPRKMRARLEACPVRGSSVGWGVQYVEALNELYVFLFGCFGFLACLGVSVTWTVVKDDIQGGFAIGGFVLAFVLFCGGMLHSYVT